MRPNHLQVHPLLFFQNESVAIVQVAGGIIGFNHKPDRQARAIGSLDNLIKGGGSKAFITMGRNDRKIDNPQIVIEFSHHVTDLLSVEDNDLRLHRGEILRIVSCPQTILLIQQPNQRIIVQPERQKVWPTEFVEHATDQTIVFRGGIAKSHPGSAELRLGQWSARCIAGTWDVHRRRGEVH